MSLLAVVQSRDANRKLRQVFAKTLPRCGETKIAIFLYILCNVLETSEQGVLNITLIIVPISSLSLQFVTNCCNSAKSSQFLEVERTL